MALTAADTAPAADHAPDLQSPTAAVAVGTLNSWIGRPLHYAPGPAETVSLLHRLIMLRTKARSRQGDVHDQLLAQHPGGWLELGAAVGGARRARRAPSPLGTCLCHRDDGSARPHLAVGYSDRDLDPGIRYLFVIRREGLIVAARNTALPEAEFDQVGFAEWTKTPDFTGVDAAAAKAIAYTEDERTANVLRWLAEALGPAGEADASTLGFLLAGLRNYLPGPRAQASAVRALARAAAVPAAELRDHLEHLSHDQQLALLRDTAEALTS
jgi:hypothetical protein